jgi:hypothetical protein
MAHTSSQCCPVRQLIPTQHRVRQRRQECLQFGDVDLGHLTGRGDPQRSQRAQRGIGARDVFGDSGAGLHRRSVGVARADPARYRLHGQRRGIAIPKWSVLSEI